MKSKPAFYLIGIILFSSLSGCNPDQLLQTKTPVIMTVASNIPDTDFSYREQKTNQRSNEGWIAGGKGKQVDIQLFVGGRYEIKAKPPGHRSKSQRFHEPGKFYEFTFYKADGIPSPPKPPTPSIPSPSPDPQENVASTGEAWAVIVGISEYQYNTAGIMENLSFAQKDADDFHQCLLKQGWPDDHIKKLTNKNARKKNIGYALETWLERAEPDDMIIVFWSSHAWPGPRDSTKAYFACYDSKPSDPSSAWRMDRVRQLLKERSVKNVVMIADTCHSGKIIRGGNPKAVGVIPALEEMEQSQSIPKGWIFVASADSDRKAYEDKAWSNGALTHVLLEGMSGKADGYQSLSAKDGCITMGELRGYINDRMIEESLNIFGVKLTPLFYTTSGNDDIWNLKLTAR